ncbi:glycosyltransferase family 2 protein [Alteromonas sp. 5E99-2]|uniref:glycosyltransferase family 2 protein n=1 Tax=Alteromonas sp. 5E99-2 TaxID=2817683 RepID=UPI001A988E5C|nr:glycosyltransferase family 2 protein [Alteromonas sp. 5E99-2]MBO1255303.1 glycosyltransferase family 2 protein [Alteromonas sp. 5E99-2]
MAKVKLVAVAKDEAAYLPEWIFHHLTIGFDEIDIHVNNTSDNTWELKNKLKALSQVNFIDADPIFSGGYVFPQEEVYEQALLSARADGFTHMMFLDIDEFWFSPSIDFSIKDFIQKHHDKHICSFKWLCKTNETEFSSIYEPLKGNSVRQVKTLFNVNLAIKKVDIHNVNVENGEYFLGDGKPWKFGVYHKNASCVRGDYFSTDVDPFYVVHRMHRSEMEYISLLSRGRPERAMKSKTIFKDNRNGYIKLATKKNARDVDVIGREEAAIGYSKFIERFELEEYLNKAQDFVLNRYKLTLDNIAKSGADEEEVLNKILSYLTDKKLRAVFKQYQERLNPVRDLKTQAYIKSAMLLKEAAINVEKFDLMLAEELMFKAHVLKPSGRHIAQKLEEYRAELKEQQGVN